MKAYTQAIDYEKFTIELVNYKGVEEQAKFQLEKWAKSILGDLYENERRIKLA